MTLKDMIPGNKYSTYEYGRTINVLCVNNPSEEEIIKYFGYFPNRKSIYVTVESLDNKKQEIWFETSEFCQSYIYVDDLYENIN